MATTHSESWHVQTSIGSELGPIDTETLLTMADSGMLCDADVVRRAADTDWQPLADVLELIRISLNPAATTELPPDRTPSHLPPAAPPPKQVASSRLADSNPKSSSPFPAYAMPRKVQPTPSCESKESGRSRPLPGWKSSEKNAARSVALTEEPAESEPDDGPVQNQSGSSAANAETALLDEWKTGRKKTLDRLMAKVEARDAQAILASDQELAKGNASKAEPELQDCLDDHDAGVPKSKSKKSVTSDEAADKSAPEVDSASPAPKVETWDEKRDRMRRSLPSWQVVAAIVLGIVLVIMYWPASFRKSRLIGRYYDIYCELERLRTRPENRSGMEDFSKSVTDEIQDLIPQLEKQAADREEDSKVLLWIGRDLLIPMMKNPKNRASKQERDLKKMFANWDKRHGTAYSKMPDVYAD